MASIFDVADYILRKQKVVTAMKLQKLVYYAQAWSLVWDEKPLFRARIEAWANGPVAPILYNAHRGQFRLAPGDISGDGSKLTPQEQATVDAVLKCYGDKTSQWLSDLTHAERPWREARGKLKPGERGRSEITRASMAEFYDSL